MKTTTHDSIDAVIDERVKDVLFWTHPEGLTHTEALAFVRKTSTLGDGSWVSVVAKSTIALILRPSR